MGKRSLIGAMDPNSVENEVSDLYRSSGEHPDGKIFWSMVHEHHKNGGNESLAKSFQAVALSNPEMFQKVVDHILDDCHMSNDEKEDLKQQEYVSFSVRSHLPVASKVLLISASDLSMQEEFLRFNANSAPSATDETMLKTTISKEFLDTQGKMEMEKATETLRSVRRTLSTNSSVASKLSKRLDQAFERSSSYSSSPKPTEQSVSPEPKPQTMVDGKLSHYHIVQASSNAETSIEMSIKEKKIFSFSEQLDEVVERLGAISSSTSNHGSMSTTSISKEDGDTGSRPGMTLSECSPSTCDDGSANDAPRENMSLSQGSSLTSLSEKSEEKGRCTVHLPNQISRPEDSPSQMETAPLASAAPSPSQRHNRFFFGPLSSPKRLPPRSPRPRKPTLKKETKEAITKWIQRSPRNQPSESHMVHSPQHGLEQSMRVGLDDIVHDDNRSSEREGASNGDGPCQASTLVEECYDVPPGPLDFHRTDGATKQARKSILKTETKHVRPIAKWIQRSPRNEPVESPKSHSTKPGQTGLQLNDEVAQDGHGSSRDEANPDDQCMTPKHKHASSEFHAAASPISVHGPGGATTTGGDGNGYTWHSYSPSNMNRLSTENVAMAAPPNTTQGINNPNHFASHPSVVSYGDGASKAVRKDILSPPSGHLGPVQHNKDSNDKHSGAHVLGQRLTTSAPTTPVSHDNYGYIEENMHPGTILSIHPMNPRSHQKEITSTHIFHGLTSRERTENMNVNSPSDGIFTRSKMKVRSPSVRPNEEGDESKRVLLSETTQQMFTKRTRSPMKLYQKIVSRTRSISPALASRKSAEGYFNFEDIDKDEQMVSKDEHPGVAPNQDSPPSESLVKEESPPQDTRAYVSVFRAQVVPGALASPSNPTFDPSSFRSQAQHMGMSGVGDSQLIDQQGFPPNYETSGWGDFFFTDFPSPKKAGNQTVGTSGRPKRGKKLSGAEGGSKVVNEVDRSPGTRETRISAIKKTAIASAPFGAPDVDKTNNIAGQDATSLTPALGALTELPRPVADLAAWISRGFSSTDDGTDTDYSSDIPGSYTDDDDDDGHGRSVSTRSGSLTWNTNIESTYSTYTDDYTNENTDDGKRDEGFMQYDDPCFPEDHKQFVASKSEGGSLI